MIIAYDPIAQELIIDPQTGREPLSISASGLEARFYGDDGLFSVLLGERSLEITFTSAPDGPFEPRVDTLAANHWRIRIERS